MSGSGISPGAVLETDASASHGYEQSIETTLPPLGVLLLAPR